MSTASMKKPKRKMKVYQENPKTEQTTHWDLDYMTYAQIDALLEQTRGRSSKQKKVRLVRIVLGLVLLLLLVLGIFFSNYPK
jgi:hypothetical protein